MKFIPGNAQHIGSRKEQQDAFGFSDPQDLSFAAHGGFLAVLADGAGGMEHGGAASRAAVRTFLEAYGEKSEHEEIQVVLQRCLTRANTVVRALGEREGAEDNVATTLLAAVLQHDRLHWVSVGDSALYLYRDGSLSLLTDIHTYAQELDQEARLGHISQESALRHPERDALTSYVGIRTLWQVNQSQEPVELNGGDKVLLGSDGLFKTLTMAEIANELSLAPQECCDSLISKTLQRNRRYQDNVTVLCIRVDENEDENRPTRRLAPEHEAGQKWRFWINSLRQTFVFKKLL
jgi:PPM family protein phosphatase